MIVTIPQNVLDVCIALEKTTGRVFGINFDLEMDCWVIVEREDIVAKLSPRFFGRPPEASLERREG